MSATPSFRAPGDWLDRVADVRAIALLRILLGPIVVVHLWTFHARAAAGDYFAHRFYIPFFEGWPVLELDVYVALLRVGIAAAIAMALGAFTRLATFACFAVVTFNTLSNQLFFHHNRAFLITVLFGMTLLRPGGALSVDAWWRRRTRGARSRGVPYWRLVLVRGLACTPYLASGTSKLIDPDWFGGVVMYDRVLRHRHLAEARGVPGWLLDAIATPGLHAVFWKFIVLSEIYIGLGYWFRRTRTSAIFLALGFHVIIEITSTVSVFSYLGVAATLLWVEPRRRTRTLRVDPADPAAARLARRVRRLDWLQRFDVREVSGATPSIALTDDAGHRFTGRAAAREAHVRLPLLFPVAYPWAVLRRTLRWLRAARR